MIQSRLIFQKDYKIGLLKKHLAMKREQAEKEAREKMVLNGNGSCRLRNNTDLSRQESLRGITVLRGQIPGVGTTAESYL